MQLSQAGGDQPPLSLCVNGYSVPFQTAQPETFNKGMEMEFDGKGKQNFSFQGILWKRKYM